MMTLYQPLKLTVTVDGRKMHVRSPMALVASSAYQLEQYDFDGADAVRQGKLALILAPTTTAYSCCCGRLRFCSGASTEERPLMHTGHEITISARKKRLIIARDGQNETMVGPYRFTIRPPARCRSACRPALPTKVS
jgi:hypothetical protein